MNSYILLKPSSFHGMENIITNLLLPASRKCINLRSENGCLHVSYNTGAWCSTLVSACTNIERNFNVFFCLTNCHRNPLWKTVSERLLLPSLVVSDPFQFVHVCLQRPLSLFFPSVWGRRCGYPLAERVRLLCPGVLPHRVERSPEAEQEVGVVGRGDERQRKGERVELEE